MALGYYGKNVSFFVDGSFPELERHYAGFLACGDGYTTNTCEEFQAPWHPKVMIKR